MLFRPHYLSIYFKNVKNYVFYLLWLVLLRTLQIAIRLSWMSADLGLRGLRSDEEAVRPYILKIRRNSVEINFLVF